MPYFILAALLVVADQVVKFLVRANIPLYTRLDFIPGFDLTYIQNTGAAFSILSSHTWILTALSGVVSVILAVMLVKNYFPEKLAKVSLALLLGGAIGNFIDRVLFGFVTDMFATTFMNFPVFNVADMGVVAGGFLLCFYVLLTMKDEGKEEKA